MELLNSLIKLVTNAGPELLTMAAVIVVGYCVKVMPWIDNKFIPAIGLAVALLVYPFMDYPIVRKLMIAAVFWLIAWMLHALILKQFEEAIRSRFPGFLPKGEPQPKTDTN